MLNEILIETSQRYQLIDITKRLEEIVSKSKIKDGLLIVFVPHSTAGILVTENEEGLKKDWNSLFKKMVSGIDFLHNRIDDNADSHLLSGLINQEKVFIIDSNKIVRGTWQQVFLAEFDGPRTRRVIVKILREK